MACLGGSVQCGHYGIGRRDFWVREIIEKIVLGPDQMTIELSNDRIEACMDFEWPEMKVKVDSSSTCLYKPTVEYKRGKTILTLAIQIKRLDGRRMLLAPDGQDLVMATEPEPKDHIVTAIGNAYHWREQMMKEGLTLPQFASRMGISASLIRKYQPLINLSPEILKRALMGDLPSRVTMQNLLSAARDLDWSTQAQFLGLERFDAAKSS